MVLLATKIKASRFVCANAKQFGAKWLIKRYAKIMADEYADFVLTSQQHAVAASLPEKSFLRHSYTAGQLNNVFTNLDEI